MKRKAILSIFILLILGLSSAGCEKDKGSGSSASSGPASSATSQTSESDTSLSGTSSSASSSRYASEYTALLNQLDDLEKALNGLDQVSNGDVEIPTP